MPGRRRRSSSASAPSCRILRSTVRSKWSTGSTLSFPPLSDFTVCHGLSPADSGVDNLRQITDKHCQTQFFLVPKNPTWERENPGLWEGGGQPLREEPRASHLPPAGSFPLRPLEPFGRFFVGVARFFVGVVLFQTMGCDVEGAAAGRRPCRGWARATEEPLVPAPLPDDGFLGCVFCCWWW